MGEKKEAEDMAKILISILGIGKGTWGHVARLIQEEEWGTVFLVANEWGQENFKPGKEVEWIIANNRAGFEIFKDAIKEKLVEGEICVNIASGSGKEHMALLAALREKGMDYKIVTLTGDGVKYY